MEIRFKRCLVLAVLAVVAGATAVSAGSVQWESYAVKFQCGNIESGSEVTAVDGRYFTTVNIHNPHYLMDATGAPIPVQFFKKIVLALPQFTDPLPPSCYL